MTENKTTLREAKNEVTIEGTLLEIRHQEWKSGQGLSIELDIEVAENEIHTVHGMSKYKKKDGTDNTIAKGYQTIVEEYKSVASHGRENADKVRITQGKIDLNEYWGQDGKLRSFPQINSNFINRVQANEKFEPRAEFAVEIFVKLVTPETKNGEETGRTKIEAYIPAFGGKVLPFNFVTDENVAEYVQDNFEVGVTALVSGDIVNFSEQKVIEKSSGFGKPQKQITNTFIREYLVTGGDEPYDEDNVKVYDAELIRKALTEREIYLEGLKNKKEEPKKETKKGFGSKVKEEKPVDISSDDLPF
ncbi:hypothetical protein [Metabacillus fastidiosus]|uniref:hypothetical protein n=1 Tax=Metabacillus fastidiosus TaxID=1458 RepID=UPI003D26AFB7